MPRRNRSRRPQRNESKRPPKALPREGAAFFGTQVVDGPRWSFGAPYLMRQMGAQAATKYYVCPGCNQNIPPGVAHIVAWPQQRAEERRHWHKPCWERR